jgi:hypothetical protein
LDLALFGEAVKSMDIIMAQQSIESVSNSSFTSLKKNAQSSYIKNLQSRAYPDFLKDRNVVSLDDAAKILRSRYGFK